MAKFESAIPYILENEGGYSTDANGTMYGITNATAASHGYHGDMKALPLSVAMDIYHQSYWTGLDLVNDQAVSTKILDLRVNFGIGGGTSILQEALNGFDGISLDVDGGFGPATLHATNSVDPAALLQALADTSAAHYQSIAAANPEKEQWLAGWLRRAQKLPVLALENPGLSGLVILALVASVVFLARKVRA